MANQKSKQYLNNLIKAENWLANYIAKATKGIDAKDSALLQHKIKQAEILLLQGKVKGVPNEDGGILAPPIEEMSPLILKEELKGEMIVELSKKSNQIKR